LRAGENASHSCLDFTKKVKISPFETQKQRAAGMEEQEKIIEANKKLIGIIGAKNF